MSTTSKRDSIAVTDLREQLGPLVDRIQRGTVFEVTRRGRPLMVLLPALVVERVKALHARTAAEGECVVCETAWPCQTLRLMAVDG